jgi:hypothetical protein
MMTHAGKNHAGLDHVESAAAASSARGGFPGKLVFWQRAFTLCGHHAAIFPVITSAISSADFL